MDQILAEEMQWDEIVPLLVGKDARLLSVSSRLGDSRVYSLEDRVAKMRRLAPFLPPGVRTLEEEAVILEKLGRQFDYKQRNGWECLIMNRIRGQPLDHFVGATKLQKVSLLRRLAEALRELHAMNVAHCDIRADNILTDDEGCIALIDFDRAQPGSGLEVDLMDWLGIGGKGVENPYWKFALFFMAPKMRSLLLRVRTLLFGTRNMMPRPQSDESLTKLQRAWDLAARSSANSPGKAIAYYSFTFKGWHFLGERPWYLRWEFIRHRVDFHGRRVLELGSNMGLLSSFASIHGAEKAMGIDQDPQIIEAAKLVASALGSGAQFQIVDLIGDHGWEDELANYDIVVATSLLHWLPNKERVLEFLGAHDEIIYEGHNDLVTEVARLEGVGFRRVDVLGITERNRYLLHGSK